jgi:hypothetical protein
MVRLGCSSTRTSLQSKYIKRTNPQGPTGISLRMSPMEIRNSSGAGIQSHPDQALVPQPKGTDSCSERGPRQKLLGATLSQAYLPMPSHLLGSTPCPAATPSQDLSPRSCSLDLGLGEEEGRACGRNGRRDESYSIIK